MANGSYVTRSRGRVRRMLCRSCGHRWEVAEKPEGLFANLAFYDSDEAVLQSFALLAEGLTFHQVAGLVDRKLETIRDRLVKSFAIEELWNLVEERLIAAFRVSPLRIVQMTNVLVQVSQGETTFHAGERRAVVHQIRSKRWNVRLRQRHKSQLRAGQTSSWQQRGLPLADVDGAWEGFVRDVDNTFDVATSEIRKERTRLQRRAEQILRSKIIVTARGDFYRLGHDVRVKRWFEQAQRFDADEHPSLLLRMTGAERDLLGRINSLPSTMTALRKLEQQLSGSTVIQSENLTLDDLAEPGRAEAVLNDLKALASVLSALG